MTPLAAVAAGGKAVEVERAAQRLARTTGLLFVALLVFGMLTVIVLDALLVPGDAAATAENVLGSRWLFGTSLVGWVLLACADIAVAVTFYALLKPAGPVLALLAAAFRLVYAALLVALLPQLFNAFQLLTATELGSGRSQAERQVEALAGLESFRVGFEVGLVVFGVHLILLGVLLHRSGYVPRFLAGLVVAAGTGYATNNLAGLFVDLAPLLAAALVAPALFGEIGLMIWLLFKGVRVNAHSRRSRPVGRAGFEPATDGL